MGGNRATTTEKVRNVSPIKINEFRTGTSANPTNAFIELYNAGDSTVDLSNWTLTEHPTQQPIFSTVTVPAGTTLAGHRFYLLGLSNSGLAAPASAGDTTINVSSTTGLAPGQQVQIGTGSAAETRTIAHITNTGATGPRVPGKIGNAVKLSGNGEYVEPAERHRQRAARLHDLGVGQPVRQPRLVAGLRLRHRHRRLHVPHAQRRRRPAAVRHHHQRRRRRAADHRPAARSR